MSQEDLEKTRAERSANETAKKAEKGAKKVKAFATAGTGRRGWNCKSLKEAEALEPKAKYTRRSYARVGDDYIASAP